MKVKEDIKFIKQQYKSSHAAEVYSEFDCCVNFVDFNLQENDSHVFYPYVGNTTEQKIVLINKYLGAVESTYLTQEIILKNPQSVWKFKREMEEEAELIYQYNRIISNDIRE